MKVVDIFDGNQNLIERTAIEDLGFKPDNQSILRYAQQCVYENAYYNWMEDKNLSYNEKNEYHDEADAYAAREADYASWKIKDISDHI